MPVRVINLGDVLRGQCDESAIRKDFTPGGAVAIGRALEERERKRAAERQGGLGGRLLSLARPATK